MYFNDCYLALIFINREDGFCDGLVKSRTIIMLLSRDAINHATNKRQSFVELTAESPCDNVLLEHRMALEFRALGLLQNIFPVMIGDFDETTIVYSNYFAKVCLDIF